MLTGSSPRIRGKLVHGAPLRCIPGLIPAHTGKTPVNFVAMTRYRAHPRAYGENPVFSPYSDCAMGSSPRIRGKR